MSVNYSLIVITILLNADITLSSFCFWNTDCSYRYFSSKTPYSAVRGDIRDSVIKIAVYTSRLVPLSPKSSSDDGIHEELRELLKNSRETCSDFSIFGNKPSICIQKVAFGEMELVQKTKDGYPKTGGECEPISIWGMFRHGKTNPDQKSATRMKEAIAITRDLVVSCYEKGRCSLCAQDIDNLRDWPIDNDMFDKTSALQDEGRKEIFGIASRLKQVYPQLGRLDKESYRFRPTQYHWVKESADAFVKGLGNDNVQSENPISGFDFMDPINDAEEDSIFSEESNQYKISSDYLAAKERIQRRLGIDYRLTDDNITALYDLCHYTWSGLNNKASPWCALFTTADLKVLEYVGDLLHYYRNGYGRQNAEMYGRKPLMDLLDSFQMAKAGKGRKMTAYFTRAEILDMVFTALGWFKDSEPITAAEKKQDRFWKTSRISVLAANLVMVLNKCTNKQSSDYHVMFYMNEQPLRSVCEGGICSWAEFEKILGPLRENTLMNGTVP